MTQDDAMKRRKSVTAAGFQRKKSIHMAGGGPGQPSPLLDAGTMSVATGSQPVAGKAPGKAASGSAPPPKADESPKASKAASGSGAPPKAAPLQQRPPGWAPKAAPEPDSPTTPDGKASAVEEEGSKEAPAPAPAPDAPKPPPPQKAGPPVTPKNPAPKSPAPPPKPKGKAGPPLNQTVPSLFDNSVDSSPRSPQPKRNKAQPPKAPR
eukprot:gnl/MRDRNA2_/MRDRNA2_230137_c0_seq1.p1 gnl/MRDRNA2_/MRDRNA2_230137_c0~~gnl/MRDRNA2_/MRDRNA2_230137_c0_seq1.p1  ORF type:complete len:215 (-),score=63.48 gnl/MRDRNA2_/MRDRNA2_230137_c0_seq1:3-626(-)